MNSPSWDPDQYERFAAERSRPFVDLVAQIPTAAPRAVVDLGCGPGTMTATLCRRWPDADILGIDSSAEMIGTARRLEPGHNEPARRFEPGHNEPARLSFALGDIAVWRPEPASHDVILSNAALQWLPNHVDLLPGWLAALRPGGTLAFQVPASGSAGAGTVFRAVATSPRWADRLAGVAGASGPQGRSPVRTPAEYVEVLAGNAPTVGAVDVNAWETTYLHLLAGSDPVLEWFTGTGLRPFLDALDEPDRAEFRADIAKGLREVYPQRPFGTVLPFRRIFVVATRR